MESKLYMEKLKDPLTIRQYGEKYWKIPTIAFYCSLILIVLAVFILIVSHSTESANKYSQYESSWQHWNSKTRNLIGSIRIKGKVMPSLGKGVNLEFDHTTKQSKAWLEACKYDKIDCSGYGNSFHIFTNETNDKFATLAIDDRMVPTGDAGYKCIHISWTPIEQADNIKSYQDVAGFQECSLAKHRNAWFRHDPFTGVDVRPWYQYIISHINCGAAASCGECTKKGGWYNQYDQTCYRYRILDMICLTINPVYDEFGQVNWTYAGGCFDGEVGHYFDGVPGQVYYFDQVPMEVRLSSDPLVILMKETGGHMHVPIGSAGSFYFALTLIILAILLAGFAIGFKYYLRCIKIKPNPNPYDQQQDSVLP